MTLTYMCLIKNVKKKKKNPKPSYKKKLLSYSVEKKKFEASLVYR